MKKIIALLGAVSLFAVVLAAQEYPRGEVFLGFTYTRMNSATNVPAFSANGAGGQFVFNLHKWIGVVADVGSVHNGNVGGYHLDTTLTNFMFGPRIPIRIHSRVTPYIQALWGGVYGSTSYPVTIPTGTPIVNPLPPQVYNAAQAVSLRASAQQTAFAQAYGGGIDIKINNWLTFRPVGLDYYMTRLQNLRTANDNNQNNLRYTTGFSFTFGAR